MELVKISRKEFLNRLNKKNVSLLVGRYCELSLNDALKQVKERAVLVYNMPALDTGLFKARSNGYIRDYSYYTFNTGAECYTDNNKIFVIYTPGYTYDKNGNACTKANVIVLRKED